MPAVPTLERTASGAGSVLALDGYRRLLISAAAVVLGVMGQAVARGWVARDLTGTNAGIGGVLLVFGIALLLATPWGGVAADRFPKRTVLLISVGALTVSSLLLGLVVLADVVAYWQLLVAGAIQATAFAFYLPARIAFITELVAAEQIGAAVVLSQTAQEAGRVVGPAAAGVLIGVSWCGTSGIFFLAGGVMFAAGLVLFGLPPGSPRHRVEVRSPVAELVDGFRYVRSHASIGLIAVTTIAVVVFGFPYLAFLPALADDRFAVGAGGYGIMSGAAGLGAVVAGLLAPRVRWIAARPWAVIAISGAALGVALAALGVAESYPVALVVLAVVGAAALVFQTTSQSLLLSLSDLEYHGRLQSLVVLGFSGFGLAALPLGLLADAWSLRAVLVAMGGVVIAVSAVFAVVRRGQRRVRLDHAGEVV